MAVKGQKAPQLALVVLTEEVFVHCGKCMLRSNLWDHEARLDVTGLPSHARCLVDHAGLTQPLEAVEASVQEGNKNKLY